jgi:hypothetical protein
LNLIKLNKIKDRYIFGFLKKGRKWYNNSRVVDGLIYAGQVAFGTSLSVKSANSVI